MMEPKIRFKGFEGEWKEYSLGELGSIYSGIGFPECEQGGKSGFPFYKVSDMNNQGNESIMLSSNNYVSDKQIQRNHWKICSDIPAIFFAKVGAAVMLNRKRVVLEPCLCDNNTMMFSLSKDKWSTNFALPLFNNVDFPSLAQVGSLPSFNGSQVKEIKVKLPKFEEQEMVGKYFTSLDSQISASTSRLASLKQMKAASLQAMFPQEGETVPKVRFKGFEGEWKKVKLGEIAEINPDCKIPDSFEYIDLESVVGTNMISHRREKHETAPSRAQRLAVKGDIFYQTVRPYQKNNYFFNLEYKDYVFSSGYAQIRTSKNALFLFAVIQGNTFLKQVMDNCTGTSFPAINPTSLKKLIVFDCDIEEQRAIGNYFSSLDHQITLQTHRLEKLKQIKSACLEKMFV